MLGEESTTKILVNTMKDGGFDLGRDQLLSYKLIEGQSLPQWREAGYGGGLLVDWNLKTTVEGLYAAERRCSRRKITVTAPPRDVTRDARRQLTPRK
jgi:hypothetical protein